MDAHLGEQPTQTPDEAAPIGRVIGPAAVRENVKIRGQLGPPKALRERLDNRDGRFKVIQESQLVVQPMLRGVSPEYRHRTRSLPEEVGPRFTDMLKKPPEHRPFGRSPRCVTEIERCARG